MKDNLIIIVASVFLFSGCYYNQSRKIEQIIETIEEIGVEKFEKIGYGTRGQKETYSFDLKNNKEFLWTYNLETNKFEFVHPEYKNFRLEVNNPEEFAQNIRNNIKKIEPIMISSWNDGNVINFWISGTEYLCYIKQTFDTAELLPDWKKSINEAKMIKTNWFLINTKE